jgi:hypothetical protein
MSKKLLTPLNLLTRASDPSSGSEGDVYFNTTEKSIKVHNGIVWVAITNSLDPTPFYEHTHTYDGDVHTIDIQNKITFKDINTEASVLEEIPVIIGFDGGNPNSTTNQPSSFDLTLLDGGNISGY